VRRPKPANIAGLIEAVRSEGSVHYPRQTVAGDFLDWRRQVRKAARARGLRISVTRRADFVVVENTDYEVSDDDARATADVLEATLAGRTRSFDDALRARRQQRMRLVVPPSPKDRSSTPSAQPCWTATERRSSPPSIQIRRLGHACPNGMVEARRGRSGLDWCREEIALHAARQRHLDERVRAASDHLHLAILVLRVAEDDLLAAVTATATAIRTGEG
jgi:hypothetical protein